MNLPGDRSNAHKTTVQAQLWGAYKDTLLPHKAVLLYGTPSDTTVAVAEKTPLSVPQFLTCMWKEGAGGGREDDTVVPQA